MNRDGIPPKWRALTLGSLASFKSGGTPNKADARFWGGDLPWVTAKDLKSVEIRGSQLRLSAEGENHAKCVDNGAILLLVRGMALHRDIPMV